MFTSCYMLREVSTLCRQKVNEILVLVPELLCTTVLFALLVVNQNKLLFKIHHDCLSAAGWIGRKQLLFYFRDTLYQMPQKVMRF